MQKLSPFWLVAILASTLLAGCAGAPAPAGATTTLSIEMNEFSFSPASFSVPAGKQIKLQLKNSGSIQHDFIILKKGVVLPGKFDSDKQADDVYFHAVLDSGKSDSFTFTAPDEPGEYQVICGIAGHFQAGMIASMTVEAP